MGVKSSTSSSDCILDTFIQATLCAICLWRCSFQCNVYPKIAFDSAKPSVIVPVPGLEYDDQFGPDCMPWGDPANVNALQCLINAIGVVVLWEWLISIILNSKSLYRSGNRSKRAYCEALSLWYCFFQVVRTYLEEVVVILELNQFVCANDFRCNFHCRCDFIF